MSRKRYLLVFTLLFAFAVVLSAPSNVAAAASGSGPTQTTMGMPVQWTLTGLTASTDYEVICTIGTNYTVIAVFTSDSNGAIAITISHYNQYGSNHYVVQPDGGGTAAYEFNIDNMDIIPYFVVLITFSILMSLLGFCGGR